MEHAPDLIAGAIGLAILSALFVALLFIGGALIVGRR